VFGSKPVAAITAADVASFRANLLAPHPERSYVTRGVARKKAKASTTPGPCLVTRSPKTVKHVIGTLKRMLDVAVDDQAIPSNPVVAGRRHTTKRRAGSNGKAPFKHRPLASGEVAAICEWIARVPEPGTDPTSPDSGRGNSVYALAVLFAAYTGVRMAELQGLQVHDITLSDISGTVGSIRVQRTAQKVRPEGADSTAPLQWQEGTPKSDASTDRVIPLAPWLADDMRNYLTQVHPFAGKKRIGHAPLFPGKRARAGRSAAKVEDFDWAKPIVADNLYHNYFQPACKALKVLTASGSAPRLYDLRHTYATLALSAGEHYMAVSKWLGHSSFVLTLTTYADYIREDDTAAPNFKRPVAIIPRTVVPLKRKAN
jgi:integrase